MIAFKYALAAIQIFPLECFSGFMKDPSVDEIINGVYKKISLGQPHAKKWHVPPGLPMNKHIKRITKEFKRPDGQQKMNSLIDRSMHALQDFGRLDWDELWNRFMLSGSLSEQKLLQVQQGPLDPHHPLLDRLYNQCVSIESYKFNKEDPIRVEVSEETVKIAINFHTLSMVWKRYAFLYTMVTQLAIYHHSPRFPTLLPAEIRKSFKNDEDIVKMVTKFWTSVHLKGDKFSQEKDFYEAIEKIVPEPYKIQIELFPVYSRWMDGCEREYHMINELLIVCQQTGPIMTAHGYEFWDQLEKFSSEYDLKPLLESYKELCEFFAKGFPFDKLFEFYTLVSRIGVVSKFLPILRARKEQLEEIAFLLCDAMSLDYLVTHHEATLQIVFESYRTDLPLIIKQKTCQLSNFMQEELEQKLFPHLPRKPKNGRRIHREWNLELGKALEHVKLSNKNVMSHECLTNTLRSYREGHDFLDDQTLDEPTRQNGINDYSKWVKSILGIFRLHTGSLGIIPLQNTPVVWKAMKKATEREFATISMGNAKVLVACLRRAQRAIRNVLVLDRIYYAMRLVRQSKRKQFLKDVKARFESSQQTNKMTKIEAEILERLYTLIGNNSEKSDYDFWKQSILSIMSYLPTYMVNTLGDMFSDCSRDFLSAGKKYDEELLQEGSLIESKLVFKEIRQDWLSEKAKEEIKWILESYTDEHIQSLQHKFMDKKELYGIPLITPK
ncbi:hypothetical protein PGT21_009385 [Puccinia graminis f. sp. tritici]|uniref:Uncharacterized protein n=1 Tax=Puccinia graminis f. sp. tritici TaxID=56615 RepID=A0A5B0Q559_PUCGR|nr:hypothetical protein PGT21_009385 [Puccinia graminis f. sp. tritici]